MAVLCAVDQPIDRAGLAEIFDKEISRDLLPGCAIRGLIANSPRAPGPGPYLCDHAGVPGDVRSAEPAGYAGVRIARLNVRNLQRVSDICRFRRTLAR